MTWGADSFPRKVGLIIQAWQRKRGGRRPNLVKKTPRDVARQDEVADSASYVAGVHEQVDQPADDDVEQQVKGADVADGGTAQDVPQGTAEPPQQGQAQRRRDPSPEK